MVATSYLPYIPVFVAIYLATIYICGKLQKRPPSPFLCFPVIGHLYLVTGSIIEAFTNLANCYGPVVFLRLGSRPALLVSSPAAVEECLNKNDIVFCNRPSGSLAGKYRGYDYTSLNLSPYGAHWRNLRKICTVEILSSHRLQSLAAIRADEVMLLIKRLSGSVTEMRPQIFNTTLNIMTRMIFGERYFGLEVETEKSKRLREFVDESLTLAGLGCIGDDIPCLRWLDRSAERRFRKYRDETNALMTELMEEHRIKRKEMKLNVDVNGNNKVKPMINALLELQESNPDYYQDHLLHSLIVDLLIGSSETSMNTMEWALSLLLNHPQVLQKVRTEIDNHVGYERFLEEPDLNQLPYLRCILDETLRMYPPLPFLIPHESSKDCVVGGYRIPRGTFLIVNAHTIQNDPKIWDDPRTFRPERFGGIDGQKMKYKMMPFGSGRRSCPGEGLAIRVLGMMLGTLIQCLDFQRLDDNLVDMSPLNKATLQRAEPLTARFQPRQVMINLLHKL